MKSLLVFAILCVIGYFCWTTIEIRIPVNRWLGSFDNREMSRERYRTEKMTCQELDKRIKSEAYAAMFAYAMKAYLAGDAATRKIRRVELIKQERKCTFFRHG